MFTLDNRILHLLHMLCNKYKRKLFCIWFKFYDHFTLPMVKRLGGFLRAKRSVFSGKEINVKIPMGRHILPILRQFYWINNLSCYEVHIRGKLPCVPKLKRLSMDVKRQRRFNFGHNGNFPNSAYQFKSIECLDVGVTGQRLE